MLVWDRFEGDFGTTFATEGSNDAEELISNQGIEGVGGGLNVPTDLVIVDGILTVVTTTDDLMGVRLIVAPENLILTDFTSTDPAPHDPMVWYSWYCARGPLVFRLRSKRTIKPEHKLWIQAWKASGTASSVIHFGLLAAFVVKH